MSQDTDRSCHHALTWVKTLGVSMGTALLVAFAPHILASCVRPVSLVMDEPPPSVWATDGEEQLAVARPMPKSPFPGQKAPPCGRRDVAINGACWREMAKPPDPGTECGPDEFLHEGKCYLPVKKAPRQPTSVEP